MPIIEKKMADYSAHSYSFKPILLGDESTLTVYIPDQTNTDCGYILLKVLGPFKLIT